MKTTRRDALAHGGRIIATAAVLPLLSSLPVRASKTDAVLIGLDRRHLGVMEELKRNLDQRRLVLDSIPDGMKREIESYTSLSYGNGEPKTIVRLHEAWPRVPKPLLKRYEKALDERGMPRLKQQEDEIYARLEAIETEINETSANGFKGLAIKLRDNRAGRLNILGVFNLRSALRDAERLAGRVI